MLIDNRRCVIQAYELGDFTYDRVSMLYFRIGVEFKEGIVFQGLKYFFDKKELVFCDSTEILAKNMELFIKQYY